MTQRVAEVGVVDLGETLARGAAGGDGRQTLFDIAAVAGEVGGGQALQQRPMRRLEVAQGDEVSGQGYCLVAGPGLESADELKLVDQAVLEGEHPKEQVAIGACHGTDLLEGPWSVGARLPRRASGPSV